MENSTLAVSVKIFGVGTAGVNILEQIAKAALPGVTLAAINTDAKSLATSCATEKIALETKPTRGAGPSGDPKRSRTVAEENLPKLKQACERQKGYPKTLNSPALHAMPCPAALIIDTECPDKIARSK